MTAYRMQSGLLTYSPVLDLTFIADRCGYRHYTAIFLYLVQSDCSIASGKASSCRRVLRRKLQSLRASRKPGQQLLYRVPDNPVRRSGLDLPPALNRGPVVARRTGAELGIRSEKVRKEERRGERWGLTEASVHAGTVNIIVMT